MNIEDAILQEINNFSKVKDVKILLVVEAGSRAWGFESKDSDYDVRFIYSKRKEKYLELNQGKDVVDLIHTDDLDIVGWDISKFLKLIYKSNPNAYELLHCKPYYEDDDFKKIREVVPLYYNNFKTAWHYYSISEKHNRKRRIENKIPNKKTYLHAVRATLCAMWAYDHQYDFPPRNIEDLKFMLDEDLIPIVDGIIVDKKCGIADLPCDNIPELDEWLLQSNAAISSKLKNKNTKHNQGWYYLNQAFLSILS